MDNHPQHVELDARSAHSTGFKTRSVTRPAPLNLLGGYRLSNAIKIEAELAGYIRTIEARLRLDEPTAELPAVELPPLIPPDPFDIPPFLERRCGRLAKTLDHIARFPFCKALLVSWDRAPTRFLA